MNNINPHKLLNSKWTAAAPTHKEKHFMVTDVEFDEEQRVVLCRIEAVFTQRSMDIHWRDLCVEENWIQGWK